MAKYLVQNSTNGELQLSDLQVKKGSGCIPVKIPPKGIVDLEKELGLSSDEIESSSHYQKCMRLGWLTEPSTEVPKTKPQAKPPEDVKPPEGGDTTDENTSKPVVSSRRGKKT